jgi:hypothetical protein
MARAPQRYRRRKQIQYRLGERVRAKRKHRVLITCIIVLLALGIATYFALRDIAAKDTTVKQSPGKITKVIDPATQTVTFNETIFSFKLPSDWKPYGHKTEPYNMYSYHNTDVNPGSRSLDIYVDTIPDNMGVNRLVAVTSQGNRLTHKEVTDNCFNFTGGAALTTQMARQQGVAVSSYQGTTFLCDIGNFLRNVDGTSSSQGPNKVTLTGPTSGAHIYFFVYTDRTTAPNYQIFYAMLDSFRAQ